MFNFIFDLFIRVPHTQPQQLYQNCGQTTWYHEWYHGRQTSSGALYDRWGYTAASRDYKNGTKLLVTNQQNNRTVEVEVNDTGDMPFLDLSEAASQALSSDGTLNNYYVCVAEVK